MREIENEGKKRWKRWATGEVGTVGGNITKWWRKKPMWEVGYEGSKQRAKLVMGGIGNGGGWKYLEEIGNGRRREVMEGNSFATLIISISRIISTRWACLAVCLPLCFCLSFCFSLLACLSICVFLFFRVFLDAPSHLYKRSCPSVRRSVGP